MDQDLSLMKQLLTLNETIEEIKFRRMHTSSNDSLVSSSCNLDNSEYYLHDHEAQIKHDDDSVCSRLTVPKIKITSDNCSHKSENVQSKTTSEHYNFVEKEMTINGKTRRIIHGRGNFSLDSGYDDADYQTDVELTL